MKRILAVIVFFAAATSLVLGQTADKQEKTKGEKADVEQIAAVERDGNEATVKVATLSKLLAEDWIRLLQTSNRRPRDSTPLTSCVTYPIGRWTRHSSSSS